MRRVRIIASKHAAGRNNANWRLLFEHRANLDRRRVRPHDVPSKFRIRRQIDIERVLNVARRMIRWCVQRVETMPFVFDLGTVLDGESHSPKNPDGPVENLGEWVQMTEMMTSSRQSGIERRF